MESVNKERLFQAIRREDVVLWAGAGFSLYAGYPSGQRLTQLLYETLTPQEQKQVDPARPLPAFAEDYLTLRGFHDLFRVVKKEFSKRPKSLKTHELLATLPFIKTIVTTNYDNLFELAYGERLDKVLSNQNIPYLGRDKVTFYKVHGDLQNPSSIVISDGHFRNFFDKKDRLLWVMIESLLATKTLLFVGYGLEDPNVLALFEKTLEALQPNMREAYFVAPNLSPLRIEGLKRKNVLYIDSTGEQLIEDLLADVKQHSVRDLQQGEASSDTMGQFLDSMGLTFSLKGNGNGFDVENLAKKEGTTKWTVQFGIHQHSTARKQLHQLTNGMTIGAVRIQAGDLRHFTYSVEGIHLPLDLEAFYVVSAPAMSWVFDVQFADGFTIDNVAVNVFGSQKTIKGVVQYRHVTLTATARKGRDNSSFTIKIDHKDSRFTSVKEELEIFDILKRLGEGQMFKCFSEGELIIETGARDASTLVVEAEYMIGYFRHLRAIEQHFGTLFKNFDKRDTCDHAVRKLGRIIGQEEFEVDWKGKFTLVKQDKNLAHIKKVMKEDTPYLCMRQNHYTEEFQVLGKSFTVSFTELQTIDHMKVQRNSRGDMSVKSHNNRLKIRYINSVVNLFPDSIIAKD